MLLLQALPHDFMIYELPHIGRIAKRELESCLELFTYPVLDDWRYENFDAENDRICWKDEMLFDSHPTIEHHLAFVKEFFPQKVAVQKVTDTFQGKNSDPQGKISARQNLFSPGDLKILYSSANLNFSIFLLI